jgi:hypothetical protein
LEDWTNLLIDWFSQSKSFIYETKWFIYESKSADRKGAVNDANYIQSRNL